MYYRHHVIRHLQSNKILALKLDHAVTGVGKAADSASRLRLAYPAYYSALYAQKLEMMYFLIDPIFEQARALKTQWASDSHIVDIITRMIR